MRSSNPALLSHPFSGGFGLVAEPNAMTIRGTIYKTVVLLALVFLPAIWCWRQFALAGQNSSVIEIPMMIGLFAGFILSLVTIFKKTWAPITAPLYAFAEGLLLGGISALFEKSYPGIVIQAISLSMATLLVMLAAYQGGWIKPTERFKLGVVAATGAIALVYFIALILSFFGVNVSFINGSGLISILFSIFVVGIAALNFVIDFDFIEQGSKGGCPKYMEWYGAFALMVTLVWLYIEILRLLAKINERK